MNRSKKLLVAIATIFILTIGSASLIYGFGGKNGESVHSAVKSTSQSTEEPTKTEDTKAKTNGEKSSRAESTKEKQPDASSESQPSSHKGSTPSTSTEKSNQDSSGNEPNRNKESTRSTTAAKSNQKTGDKNNPASALKQKETSHSSSGNSTDNHKPVSSNVKQKEHTKQRNTSNHTNRKSVPESSNVTYSIVADKGTGTILPPTVVEIKEGDTVLDVLIKITREKRIPMSFRGGTGATAYVEGIDNLFEFDKGQGSGWMYRVNGIFPNRGAGVVPLLDGDRIEWLYTLDLGKDLGAELKPFR